MPPWAERRPNREIRVQLQADADPHLSDVQGAPPGAVQGAGEDGGTGTHGEGGLGKLKKKTNWAKGKYKTKPSLEMRYTAHTRISYRFTS